MKIEFCDKYKRKQKSENMLADFIDDISTLTFTIININILYVYKNKHYKRE